MSALKSVLLVESDADLRDMICYALEGLDYIATGVESGAAASSLLRGAKSYDVLVTGFALKGGVSGLDLAKAAKEAHPNMLIVISSGHPALSLGELPPGVLYLAKPYKISSLIRLMDISLQSRVAE